MARGQRPDYVDRSIWARLRFFDRDKRLDVVHELGGEPYGLDVKLTASGILFMISTEQMYGNEGEDVSGEFFFKMLLDQSLAKSVAYAFEVPCEMPGKTHEGWGRFGIIKQDFEHHVKGHAYSIDIEKDRWSTHIQFLLTDETDDATSLQSYVDLHVSHDFGRCIDHLIAAAYAVPRLEASYRGEYPGVKGTKELTFSAEIAHTLLGDEPQE